ncbi:MAG: GIY-YIG nuclease family protein [Pacificimonas sp.]
MYIALDMRAYDFYVYILASQYNGTLYTGVTNDIERRVREHREIKVPGIT